jgi:hypothetical protein
MAVARADATDAVWEFRPGITVEINPDAYPTSRSVPTKVTHQEAAYQTEALVRDLYVITPRLIKTKSIPSVDEVQIIGRKIE